jgi:hypothetical protein
MIDTGNTGFPRKSWHRRPPFRKENRIDIEFFEMKKRPTNRSLCTNDNTLPKGLQALFSGQGDVSLVRKT